MPKSGVNRLAVEAARAAEIATAHRALWLRHETRREGVHLLERAGHPYNLDSWRDRSALDER